MPDTVDQTLLSSQNHPQQLSISSSNSVLITLAKPVSHLPTASMLLVSLIQWAHAWGVLNWVALYALLALGLAPMCDYPWELPGVAFRLTYVATTAVTEYVARGCKPLFEEWTLAFEVVRVVTRYISRVYAHHAVSPRKARFLRLQTEVVGTILGTFACWQHGVEAEYFKYNGLEHVWLQPRKRPQPNAAKPRTSCVVLYFHGGGYTTLSPRYYVSSTSELLVRVQSQLDQILPSGAVDVAFLVANYRKAPEHPYPTPPNDAHTMYRYLLDVEGVAPQNILLVGDSAGAGLSLATLMRVRDSNPAELPCGAVFSSPFVDLEMRGDERSTPYCVLADRIVDISCSMYVPGGGCPETWGDASPVHCNLSGLPAAYIITGEFDHLLLHAQRLMERAKKDGVENWQLDIHHHMVHVFMHIPPFILPSTSKGLEAIAVFAARQLAQKLPNDSRDPACPW